ncbi:fimbrial assembly family protein [Coraliomargarita sp. CAG:312]|nr:fimbrial assembly family protein [Coraliomargarita sp. CAG:312]
MSSKNKLIINCGASHVSVAEFGTASGRLVLESFQMQELNYDYSVQENWLNALTFALKTMKVSGKATIIAPSMLLLTKTIKIPHVEPDRRAEVIAFEAEKNIPYPIADVAWDYQIISDDGVETEIFLTSMKSSAADEFCAALTSVGVIPTSIEASSILDYNTWKYCGLENDVIILNVGAKFSNMLIARDDGVFVRSIPVGGNALTQHIADSIGRNFETSEELKLRFFSTSEHSGNSGAEHFTSAAKSVMQRIGIELKRSILNYRRTGRVATPKKIYLTGRASLLSGFAEYLAEDQKMSVEYLDALANVSVSPKVNQALLTSCSSQVSELVGEAVRMLMPDAMGVNLLPRHIVEETEFARKRPLMLLSAAILALAVVPPFMYLSKALSSDKDFSEAFIKATPELEARYAKLQENEKIAKSYTEKIAGLEGLAKSKSNWINLFIDLEARLMEQKDVWLDNLRVVRTGEGKNQKYNLELTGRLLIREFNPDDPTAYDPTKAVERINKLLASFTSSSFIKKFENVRTDPSTPRILKFDFTLVVNPDKPI